MATVTSDQSRRDDAFSGRIMETSIYPTATFTLTDPIDFGSTPAAGAQGTLQAKGELTLQRRDEDGGVRGDRSVHGLEHPGGGLHPDHVCGLGHLQPKLRARPNERTTACSSSR